MDEPVMSIARSLLLKAADSQWLARQMAERSFARRAVRKFMPGEEVEDALAAAKTLAAMGQGTILTQLGEALASLEDAAKVRDHYLDLFRQIKVRGLPTWISIKPTQLGIDQSLESCRGYLMELGQAAAEAGSSLWIDMEDHPYVDRTIDLYRSVRARYERTGLAIQAYLYRTPKDLEGLWEVKPWIRLVKGAYKEPPTVAYPAKRDVDLAYFDLSLKLLDAATRQQALPIFGTHDLPLVRRIIARARQVNLAPGQYEIHMLYGIRAADQVQLTRDGETVKVLISYGHAWFKWYMRRLAERPANIWFAFRSLLG
jgi:proline dehydrogenase